MPHDPRTRSEPATRSESALSESERAILLMQALDARSMHQIWVERGRTLLAGRAVDVPPEFAKREDMCPVGIWLRERLDQRLKAIPLFDRTNNSHMEFHVALDRLFGEDKDRISASARADFQRTSEELTALIEEWVAMGR